MTTKQQILNFASNEVGYKENPAGSNRTKYGRWYGMDGQPWCAMFVSYCFYNMGLPLPATTPKGFAFCPYGVTWFKNKGLWHTNSQVGDVVFYDWGGDGVSDHVGIVEKINPDGSIVAIEGNTSVTNDSNGRQVMRRTRKAGIMGYGRPNYGTPSPITPNREVPAIAPPWPGRYIGLTSPNVEGQDVLLWQRQMINRGWTLDSDGIFTESDHEVLIQFQKQKGLIDDGVIGPISWNAAWTVPITPD